MTRKGDWIQTFTGKQFWPLDPRAEDIDIIDIAHALSNICRYCGHTNTFYSVAEHSVLISEAVPKEDALWGLLHDASEAYLSDVAKPVKPYLAEYLKAEANIMAEIIEKFNLSPIMPRSVQYADVAILHDEKEQVMGVAPADWNIPYPPLGVKIQGFQPKDAKKLFLLRYRELTPCQ